MKNSTPEHILLTCFQSKGNIAKSLFASAAGDYYTEHGVDWRGIDLDDAHETFQRKFPDRVTPLQLTNSADFSELLKVYRTVAKVGVTILDNKANASDPHLKLIETASLLDYLDQNDTRLVNLIYPISDPDAQENLVQIVDLTKDRAQHVIVRNEGGTNPTVKSKLFDNSPIHKELIEAGAREITIPLLYEHSKHQLQAMEIKLGRGIPLTEAYTNDALGFDGPTKSIFRQWNLGKNGMFTQFDKLADIFLPASAFSSRLEELAGAASTATRPKARRGDRLNLGSEE